ncbi:hypothetical protein F5146DRAFT_1006351 [Armillaria mellea]|nr:hypothetical protein F5146DRAFT_1006351 [Armillaria mellea]
MLEPKIHLTTNATRLALLIQQKSLIQSRAMANTLHQPESGKQSRSGRSASTDNGRTYNPRPFLEYFTKCVAGRPSVLRDEDTIVLKDLIPERFSKMSRDPSFHHQTQTSNLKGRQQIFHLPPLVGALPLGAWITFAAVSLPFVFRGIGFDLGAGANAYLDGGGRCIRGVMHGEMDVDGKRERSGMEVASTSQTQFGPYSTHAPA